MKYWKCVECDQLFWTYDLLLKHINDTAVYNARDATTKVHQIEELEK